MRRSFSSLTVFHQKFLVVCVSSSQTHSKADADAALPASAAENADFSCVLLHTSKGVSSVPMPAGVTSFHKYAEFIYPLGVTSGR